MKPTAEQELILSAGRETFDNLLINARAGAAKTTTLELLAYALSPIGTLMLAFNKKIAEEMKLRMPPNCTCMTINGLGHRALRDFLGRQPSVDAQKMAGLLRAELEELPSEEAEELREVWPDLMDALRMAKTAGYLPDGTHPMARPLIGDDSFFELLDFKPSGLEKQIITSIVVKSFKLALKGQIDFDDQIYIPALLPVSFPFYKLTMVDEAQDLSPINHVLLKKLVKKNRIIAVGDPCQAIYGFRGTSENSMLELRQMFDMKELFLTICFRSAQNIIRNAHWRAPDMQWRPGAPDGLVESLDKWGPTSLCDGDAIICRNNAPLFRMAIELLRAKLLPELASGDVMKGLLSIMKKLGPGSMTSENAMAELERWKQSQMKRSKVPQRVVDQTECILVFLSEAETLAQAAQMLREIADRPGRIKLMTGHKSKGLEFERVFILDRFLLRPEGQDENLRYVMETRAKQELRYVQSEAWGTAPEPQIELSDLALEE